MKIEMKSKKLVKPSAPTVDHLRRLKISLIDKLQPPVYVGVIFFYLSKNDVPDPSPVPIGERFQVLEKALAETLTLFYPFAGRYIEERCLVECEDQGVEFLEAKADGTLHQFLHGETDPYDGLNHLATQPLLLDQIAPPLVVVQMTTFTCGGMVVGLRISHSIADMHTISSFLSTWAMACRGSLHKAPNMVNLCGRTNFLSQDNSCGNVYTMVSGKSTAGVTELGLHGLVNLMRDAITTSLAKLGNAIDGKDLGDMVMNLVGEFQEEVQKGDADVLFFTSWCRFALHRVNLGWGEPEFESCLCTPYDSVTLMDSLKGVDDGGVEAWVSFTEDDMDRFRRQHDILEYASPK